MAQLPTPTMATRMRPELVLMRLLLCSCSVWDELRSGAVVPVLVALGGDELLDPAHFALGGLEAVPGKLFGVGVDAARGCGP